MIKKFDKIEEIENPTVGITKKFAEEGIHKVKSQAKLKALGEK